MKSGVNLILDSNAIIAIISGHEIAIELTQNCNLYISFITELEVLSYPKIIEQEKKILRSFLNECIIIDINTEIKKNCIELRSKYHLKLPDAIIAATAKYLDLPLITADKVFNKINEVIVIQFPI
jgi:predicted nucleic acid-binding protein